MIGDDWGWFMAILWPFYGIGSQYVGSSVNQLESPPEFLRRCGVWKMVFRELNS